VANRVRVIGEARRLWQRQAGEIAGELRVARLNLGVTQREVGAAIGASASEVSRRELAQSPRLTGEKLAVHAAAVGLRLSVKLFPVGGGIRDEAQSRYVRAFLARIGQAWRTTLEAGMPRFGDLRAVDILLVRGGVRIAVEVITRVGDLQAQVRSARLKARDIGATRLILVIADTHANARFVDALRATLAPDFELNARRVLADLEAGREPSRDAFIVFRLRAASHRPHTASPPVGVSAPDASAAS
jgi:transcriptional regulator with XRE-family HTH domain